MKIMNLRKTITLLLVLSFVLLQAQMRYTVTNVPNVQLRDYRDYVSDPEGVIGYGDKQALNYKLAELRDSMDVQTAVVVLPAIDESYDSAKEFATELFNRWGIGDSESNNGLLILLLTAEGEREVVFETGYGISNVLTDGLCKLISTQKMIPYLKEEDYGRGLIAGVDEVVKVIDGSSDLLQKSNLSASNLKWPMIIWLLLGVGALLFNESRKKKQVSDEVSPYLGVIKQKSTGGIGCLLAVLFFPVFILFRLFKGGKKNAMIDCQSCKSVGTVSLKKGEPLVRQEAIPGQDGMKEYEFECSNCGFIHKELVPYTYVKPQSENENRETTSSFGSRTTSKRGSWGGGKSGGGGSSTKF